MSLVIEAGVLARAMKSAAGVVEARNTIPILSNVRMQASAGELELVTSNLDIEYRQRLPLASGGDLATTVDASKLAAIAGAVERGAQISMEIKDRRLAVKSGRSRWLLQSLPVDDFPVLPFDGASVSVAMPGAPLAAAIARTAWSASTEETRYYLCGVFLDAEDGKLRLTTTNGHTLVCLTTETDWPEAAAQVIVPSKYVRTLERLSAEMEGVTLHWSKDKIRADIGTITLTGKLINGTFPDYRRVIPSTGNQRAIIEGEGLRNAVRRMALIGSEKTRAVKLDVRDNVMALEMTSAEHGIASEELPADCTTTHAAGFNSAYLVQMLEAIGGDTIEIHHSDPRAPALVRRTVPDGVVGVVMPMGI